MEVRYLETRNDNGFPRTILTVDNETEITCDMIDGNASIKVRCISNTVSEEGYNPQAILDEAGAQNPGFWGTWMVWGEPLTIAHAVMDVINNQ